MFVPVKNRTLSSMSRERISAWILPGRIEYTGYNGLSIKLKLGINRIPAILIGDGVNIINA